MEKSLIFLFSIIAVIQCLTDEKIEHLKKLHMECYDEARTPPNLILRLTNGNWFSDNKALKRWILCILKKYGLMTSEGVYNLDTALSMVPQRDKEMIEDVINDCLPTKAAPPYEIAWAYSKCYHAKFRDHKYKGKNLHYLAILY